MKDIVADAAATDSIYKNHGITATASYYTNGQGDKALPNVETALGQG